MDPLLRVINLSKKFGALHAIRQVSFDVHPGEVVGLAGNIGSGKSVLVMLLAGLYTPNEGDLYFENRRLVRNYRAADLEIGVIHQKPELVNHLDITSNLFLGNELGWPPVHTWWKIPDRKRMDKEARQIFAQLDVPFSSLRERVCNLSSEQRQMIAIARLLTRNFKLIIIDEPTVMLSFPNQQRLLGLIQLWRQKGVAVIFSSNNIDHLFAVTDRIITLRQGRKVSDVSTDQTSRDEVVSALVGYAEPQNVTHAIWNMESYYHSQDRAEKLRYSQMLLEKDLASQDTLNQQLIEQVTEQIRTLDQANAALREAQRRLLTEREEERKHLARELHDEVIQEMLSVNYQLEQLDFERTPQLEAELGDARQNIRSLVAEIRGICGNLRPPTIDSLGVGAAIQSYTREWADHTGIDVSLQMDSNLGRLPELLELSIFRIIQEGLSNVWKHSQASSVAIELEHTSPRSLSISIRDDGIGLPENLDLSSLSEHGHYGLVGISERVALLGGRLRLQRPAVGGTIIQVEIPHPRVETEIPQIY